MSENFRMSHVWVLLVVVATLLGMSGETAAVEVNFPDANLEAAVRDHLGIPTTTPITDAHMASMTGSFSAKSKCISNIQGLEYATNLTSLALGGNMIVDISPVAGLANLTWLELSYNDINDVSAVSGLSNLNYLDLSWNFINDVSVVSGLSNLRNLYLRANEIFAMDLQGSSLTSLRYIDIEFCGSASIVLADSSFNQTSFNVLMNGGCSLMGIAEHPGIQSLDLSGVDFTDVPDLSVMYRADNLETLLFAGATNLDGSQVTQLTGELDSLAWLDVTGLWESFDAGSQSLLLDWDAVEGHTLVTAVPEPATIVLLSALVGLALLRRRRC